MAVGASEYELEALPELEAGHEGEQHESEQFFGALANLARRGGWLTAAGSPQRRFALWAARQAVNRGLPALGRWAGGQIGGTSNGATGASLGTRAASWLGGLLPQQEYEAEWEAEISPIRRIYPDAMMEHLGHAAAETHSEAEAEALAGAMVPLAARVVPQAAPALMRAAPGLVCGLAGVVRTLHRNPATRPLMRTVPAIVRRTAARIARQASSGVPVTPRAAVRTLAQQTLRLLGSPRQAAQAFRYSQRLDRRFHRAGGAAACRPVCPRCGAAVGEQELAANGWQVMCPEENAQIGPTFYSSDQAFQVSSAHNSATGHNSTVVPCTNC